jgi:hypothetical protein
MIPQIEVYDKAKNEKILLNIDKTVFFAEI